MKKLKKIFSNISDEERFEIDETRVKDRSEISIAGVTKRNDENIEIQDILGKYKNLTNYTVDLVREPNNTYDKNAIKVYLKQQHIGYIPTSYSRKIASFMDRGMEVKRYMKRIREYEDDRNKIKLGCDLIIFTLNKQDEN